MRISTTDEWGAVLRNRRKALGYTQSRLAELSGLSTSFISEVENGKKTSEIGKVLLLTNLLGLNLEVRER